MIKSIGRILGSYGDITLKIFIMLGQIGNQGNYKYKQKPSFKKWVAYGNMESITYDFSTFLQLDYNPRFNSTIAYDKNKRFNFHVHQAWKLNSFLAKTLSVIEKHGDNIYYFDSDRSNELSMFNLSPEQIEEYSIEAYGFLGNHCIKSIPAIVTDYQENKYEGYRLFFDRSTNFVDLSYDELHSLAYVINRTDFISLSQSIVNSTILWYSQNARNAFGMVIDTASDAQGRRAVSQEDENREIINKQLPVSSTGNPFKGLFEKE